MIATVKSSMADSNMNACPNAVEHLLMSAIEAIMRL